MTGLFAGSFDPFTIGHESVVRRVLPLFDRLVIAVGFNVSKKGLLPVDERVVAIGRLFAADGRVEVVSYDCLTSDFARRLGADYIIKGVRNAADFDSESVQADVNRQLCGVETLLVPSEGNLGSVSSSLVRELLSFGADVSPYVPAEIMKSLKP